MGNFESCYVGDCSTSLSDLCDPDYTINLEETQCQGVNTHLAFLVEDPASCQVLESDVCLELASHWENNATNIELEYDEAGCYNLSDLENYKYYQPQLTFMKYLAIIGMGNIGGSFLLSNSNVGRSWDPGDPG